MSLTIEHISGMEFRITGAKTFDKGIPNVAVLAIVFIYDPITDIYTNTRGITEVNRVTTDSFGVYTFQKQWLPGDYVIKFYGTGKDVTLPLDTDWETFSIAQKGAFDITAPIETEIFKITY